jgi:hypothetical protein
MNEMNEPQGEEIAVLLTPSDCHKNRPKIYILQEKHKMAVKSLIDRSDYPGAKEYCEQKAIRSFNVTWWMREW